jgi:hypothetical protein
VAFEFWHLKEARPGCCFSKMECQGRATTLAGAVTVDCVPNLMVCLSLRVLTWPGQRYWPGQWTWPGQRPSQLLES